MRNPVQIDKETSPRRQSGRALTVVLAFVALGSVSALAYGVTQTFAPVEEVAFKRKSSKRPDQLLVVRYDSMAGLRARGVVFDDSPPPRRPPVRTWEPEPRREFAPPPPPRWRP